MDLSKLWKFDFDSGFVPEIFVSLIVIILLIILCFIIYFRFKKLNEKPLETPKGFDLIVMIFVDFIDNLTINTMGKRNRNYGGLILTLAMYIFCAFTFGLTGLPSPMTYLGVPLSLALCTFVLIHYTAAKENKLKYFKRYIDPFPVFLPINLITMWAPLLSMTLRMFGNAMSGFCIMSIVYFGLENISNMIFGSAFMGNYWANAIGGVVSGASGPAGIFIAPIFTPILHLYFDLFSGFVQTTVFILLTMIFIFNEQNEESNELELQVVRN